MQQSSLPSELPSHVSATPDRLSWLAHLHRFFKFVGPTWLICITFVDPGGITAALQQGSETQFTLLWISWWSIVFGYVFQILAARIAVVSGRSLADLCVERYGNSMVRFTIWAFIEGSVFGDDIQACVGSTIALNIMTGLPWWACVLLTTAAALLLTLAYYYDATKLEATVGVMMLAMLVLVFVNVGYGDANAGDVIKGWVVPLVPEGQALTVVGSVGGVLTPSALFLGSALVLTRPVDRNSKRDVRRCLVYSTIELVIGMLVAFLIILAVTVTFANGFYTPECAAQGLAYVPSEGQCDEIALGDGPDALTLYGAAAKWVFAIALLLSGLNSMVSATIAGQATWEGFGYGFGKEGKKIPFWQRVLVTRALVLVPTLVLALTNGNDDVTYTIINDWINVFMSLAMPFAMIPTLHIAASRQYMRSMTIGPKRIFVTAFLVLGLVGINFYLLAEFLFDPIDFGSAGDFPTTPAFYAVTGALWLLYLYLLVQVSAPGVWELYTWVLQISGRGSCKLPRDAASDGSGDATPDAVFKQQRDQGAIKPDHVFNGDSAALAPGEGGATAGKW